METRSPRSCASVRCIARSSVCSDRPMKSVTSPPTKLRNVGFTPRSLAPLLRGRMNGVRSLRSGSEKPTHGAHPAVTQGEYVHPAERGTAGRAEPPGLGGGVGTDVRRAVLLQHEVRRSVVENLLDAVAERLAPHEFGL